MTDCNTAGCYNQCDLYLCAPCVKAVRKDIERIPALLEDLQDTIQRQDNTRPAPQGGSGGSKQGSAAPINLTAYQLAQELQTISPYAQTYTNDPLAARHATNLHNLTTTAEQLISGPHQEHVDLKQIRDRITAANIQPMPTKQLLPWLRKNAGITIISQHIRDWARHGHLTPATTNGNPTYNPQDVLTAWHNTARKKK